MGPWVVRHVLEVAPLRHPEGLVAVMGNVRGTENLAWMPHEGAYLLHALAISPAADPAQTKAVETEN
jgi:hypothetical protein